MAWDPAEQRRDEHPRRLGHVLRQHADAAELQRADLAAGQADHHHAADVSRIRYGGKSRESFLTDAPPNITVESNDTVNPYAHQFNAGVSRTMSRDIAVTADVSITNRYSDRDTVDPNLPDPTTKAKLYPQFARVNFWVSTAEQHVSRAAAQGRQADVEPLPVPRVLHAEQGDGHGGDEPAGRSVRLLSDRALRRRRSPPSPRHQRHRPAAGATSSCRRSPTSDRACGSPRPARSISTATATPATCRRASCRAPAAAT